MYEAFIINSISEIEGSIEAFACCFIHLTEYNLKWNVNPWCGFSWVLQSGVSENREDIASPSPPSWTVQPAPAFQHLQEDKQGRKCFFYFKWKVFLNKSHPKPYIKQNKSTRSETKKYRFCQIVSCGFLALHVAKCLWFTNSLPFLNFHLDQNKHITKKCSKGASDTSKTPVLKISHS